MNLDALRNILTLAGPTAVIVGVILALFQLRDLRRMRQMEVVMALFGRFDDDSLQRHLQRLFRWTYKNYEEFERRARESDWITLYAISAYFENMGLLYKRRLAPIGLLDDIMSGPLTISWRKVAPIWIGYRRKYQRPMMAEWFELLATDMEKRLAHEALRARQDRARREGTQAARTSRNGGGRRRKARHVRAARSGGT